MKRIDQESSKQSRALNANNETEKVVQSYPKRNQRSSRSQKSNELSSSINDLSINSQPEEDLIQDEISKFFILIN